LETLGDKVAVREGSLATGRAAMPCEGQQHTGRKNDMARISRLEKNLSAARTGLVMFDTLNGYLHPDNPDKVKFLAERNILPNMQRLLAGARKVGMTTFYPSGAHAPDGSDSVARLTDTDMDLKPKVAGDKPFFPRFHKGSKDSEIAAEVAPIAGDVVVPKHRWNSFFQTDLDLHFRVRGIETMIIAGGSTDVGIASTVYAARDMDYGIVVIRDCCYSARGNNNDFFMDRVFPRMGRVMTVDQAVALMVP
jgi:nicotinamidase-related amidase